MTTGSVRSSTRTSWIWGAKPSAWTVTIVGPALAVLQGELAALVRRPAGTKASNVLPSWPSPP